MAKDNKALRARILQLLDDARPEALSLSEALGDEFKHAIAEVIYLRDHGLIQVDIQQYYDGEWFASPARITTKGHDYRSEDGGLTRELNVVTVRLHEDTLRRMLINQVESSDADSTVKGKLIDQLKALPAELVLKLSEQALDQALRHMPGAVHWLQTVLLR